MWPKVLVLTIAVFATCFGVCIAKLHQLNTAINQHAMIIDLVVKDLQSTERRK